MKDFLGNEIKYGDYLLYPNRFKSKRISMDIVKVYKINKSTITVTKPNWCRTLERHYIKYPERSIIISEEVALKKEPLFCKA